MSTYIHKLSSHLLQTTHQKEVSLVFPNKRAGLFLREQYQSMLSKPAFMPKIYGIEEFISRLSNLQLINNVDLLFRFYAVYKTVEKKEVQPFSEFINWAQILLHDYNEIDQQLTNTEELFEYLQDIRDLESWGRDQNGKPTNLQVNFNNFWRNAASYYDGLKKDLLGEKLAYSGLAAREVVDLLKAGNMVNLDKQHFIFSGFSALTASESFIINYLHEHYEAEILWDADHYYLDNSNQEAGLFFRKNNSVFQQKEMKWAGKNISEDQKKISIIGVSQQSGQVKVAGDILKKSGDNGQNTAIVLADENLLSPLLQSIPSEIESVNVTMGYPLVNAPLYDFFEELIELFVKKSDSSFYHGNFLKLINHTYFSFLLDTDSEKTLLADIEEDIYAKNLSFISALSFSEKLTGIAALKTLFEVKDVDDLLDTISEYILLLKSYFINHKTDNHQLELEHLLGYHLLFTRIADLKTSYPYLSNFKTLLVLFRQLAGNATIDFEGEPLEGLQVMGMLETRNLDFEKVILLSANEGILPVGKTHNSFIPYDVKSKYQLPTHREKDAMFSYHFYHLIQGAKDLTIIYNTEADDLGSGEKSRFVTQIQEELKDFENIELTHKISETPINQILQKATSIVKDNDILEKIEQKLQSGLSPTSLTTYLNCPLDFYYKYVLGIQEEEKVEKDIESSSLGSALHDTLEELYKPYEGKQITEKDIDSMLLQFEAVLERMFLRDFDASAISKGKNLLTRRVAESYLERFLNKEKKRIVKSGPISLFAAEKTLKRKISHQINGEERSFILKGKVDRLDLNNGLLNIIDYKTGSVNPNELKLKEMDDLLNKKGKDKAFQLMTYAYLCKEAFPKYEFISGIESFRINSAALMNLSIDGSRQINEAFLSQYESCLKEIVSEILSKDIPFKHREDASYCEFCGD